jgi:MFS family permease
MEPATRPDVAWYRAVTREQRRTLLAAGVGWLLDSMDVQLYALILVEVMKSLKIDSATGGLLASMTLLASAFGGIVLGVVADRVGRARALMLSIVIYSVFTALCGLCETVTQLAICRILLGIGMGGEWAAGAALIAETWPAKHRGKAMGLMQSAWALGYAAAAITAALVLPRWGWRAVFFVGILPALFTIWVRRKVPEPEIWQKARAAPQKGRLVEIFARENLRNTIVVTLMNAATMFAAWGLLTWLPSYLKLPVEKGGAGLSIASSSLWIVVSTGGQWLGYVTFGFVSDRFGRKKTYLVYLIGAAVLVPFYGATRDPITLLILGPLLLFFGTGYFSGFGALTAEMYPTRIRVSAQGLTYNIGRVASAIAPFAVGKVATTRGLGFAFYIVAVGFAVAAVFALFIPDTKAKALE